MVSTMAAVWCLLPSRVANTPIRRNRELDRPSIRTLRSGHSFFMDSRQSSHNVSSNCLPSSGSAPQRRQHQPFSRHKPSHAAAFRRSSSSAVIACLGVGRITRSSSSVKPFPSSRRYRNRDRHFLRMPHLKKRAGLRPLMRDLILQLHGNDLE